MHRQEAYWALRNNPINESWKQNRLMEKLN